MIDGILTGESTFTSDKTLLRDLLNQIHRGVIQLPDFQRGWIWDDEHIRDLIESVSLAYPIGTIMLLETGGKAVHFKPRPIDGTPIPEEEPEYLILDGQQRLTSLYQAFFSGTVVNTRDSRKKPVKRWYYMNIIQALRKGADRSDAIISLSEDKKTRNFRIEVLEDYSSSQGEYTACLFPLNLVFRPAGWRRGLSEYWNHDSEKGKLFDDFEDEVIERIQGYLIPVIIVKKHTPKEAVCQVFEKVNTGGVSLTVFELLTASFAAENFALRDDWDVRVRRMKDRKVLGNMQNTDFLQAIALMVTYQKRLEAIQSGEKEENTPGVSCKRKEILRLTVDDYSKWADRVEKGFLEASRFLYGQRIFYDRDLPYRTQIVPLASTLAWLEKDAEQAGARSKLAQWYWCGVLGELYGSAVESRFARDLPEIVDWVKNGAPAPKTVDDANFTPARLYTLRTRNSAAYKGIHALLMRQGCQDFRTGVSIEEQVYFDDAIDIHHIFPYDWCVSNGVDAGRRECIINKTPISAHTNRAIGGNAPSLYLPVLQKKADVDEKRMDAIIKSHLIAPRHLRSDSFKSFFEAREQGLLTIIEQAMGKPIAREVPVQEADLVDFESAVAEESTI